MALARLARLLFGLALLAQVAASASAPAASDTRLCVVAHSEARGQSDAGASSAPAPQRDTGHRHAPCALCLFGSADSPLHSQSLSLETSRVADRARHSCAYADGLVFFQVDRNAAARAPPAFS
jgi:poly(3-hydroxybutyrate) depolymerase